MSAFKRPRQPKMTTQALLDLDLDESSSDSDFCPDHDVDDDFSDGSKDAESGDDDTTSDDDDEDNGDASEDSTEQLKALLADEHPETVEEIKVQNLLEKLNNEEKKESKIPTKPICCVCLGDRSDDSNEIIECDGCRVTVHEGCYGVNDANSISSTNSTCSTSPWFCEACRAGITEPTCELCPNKGGIYKETDVGKWVHLVCALYVPGVAFGEVDQLSSVTLFEMPYTKWGAKVCSICENSRFARTGVCIGCDAGMCKTFFHVTCAQSSGFLTEAHHEDSDAADPFYAHCKVHSEKEMMKKRKRNFHTFHMNMRQKQNELSALKLEDPSPAQLRIERKLLKHQRKYALHKELKVKPWVPTQKMSRMLTTSASACRRLLSKAEIMAVDVELLERQEAQIAALTDIRKKWHIAPAFSVEFIGYYLDRISRTKELKQQLTEMLQSNIVLTKEQDSLRKEYDGRLENNKQLKTQQESLLSEITELQKQITALCPSKSMPSPSSIGRNEAAESTKTATPPLRPISVPTAAALKMGVGFPLAHLGPPGTKVDSSRLLSTHAKGSPNKNSSPHNAAAAAVTPTNTASASSTPTLGVHTYDCGICKNCNDQHLLVKCDTCKLHYHLGCLNPPLTRPPKKSKLYGWQCSECDKSDDSDQTIALPKGPRKSRTRFNKDGLIVPIHMFEEENKKQPEPPPKRRSMDDAMCSVSKSVQRTTPIDLENFKKSIKTENQPKPSTSSPASLKKDKINTNLLPQPIKANLSSSDDCVMLVMPGGEPIKIADDTDPLAISLPDVVNQMQMDESHPSGDANRQARKQKRKDKHKNKHNLSSDTERSFNKEHKRKRKKKSHDSQDAENPNFYESSAAAASTHKIKIKLKTLPLPGEVTPEVQFLYVSADMVRSAGEASRPTSVETVEDIMTTTTTPTAIEEPPLMANEINKNHANTCAAGGSTRRTYTSPRKTAQRNSKISGGRPRSLPGASPSATINLNCCVCHQSGIQSNTVTCDECNKNYHFTCLDPPLKKTPKIRGYSWHCADCDPTDDEMK